MQLARDAAANEVEPLRLAVARGGVELLLLLETEFLGLAPRPSHARRVAEILVEWREVLERKYTGASSY